MHDEPTSHASEQMVVRQPNRQSQFSRREMLALVGTGAAATAAALPAAVSRAEAAARPGGGETDLAAMSATQLARLIRTRQVSSVEVVRACLSRIDVVNPVINAMVQNRGDAALADARAADNVRGQDRHDRPLHGVPFTVTDTVEVAGIISTAGTYGRRAFVPAIDATAVARLKAAGAIVLGVTNAPELSQGIGSDNVVYGRTNNPYDPTRNPGGNSGGEAALIAAGGSPLGLGVDAGGGLRIPAHFCGIAGLKPTSGRISRTGHFLAVAGAPERLTQFGPMSRFVEDLFPAFTIMAGGDAGDPNTSPVSLLDPSGGTSPEGMPIGVQVTTKAWREDVALAAAAVVEDGLVGWQPSPRLP